MYIRWIGAVMITAVCSYIGFSAAGQYHRSIVQVTQLKDLLLAMSCELQYRATPLPELADQMSRERNGDLAALMRTFSENLKLQLYPDASCAMDAAIHSTPRLTRSAAALLETAGLSLGRFDLSGQLKGLEEVQKQCDIELLKLSRDQPYRIRSCMIMGICIGISLAILLI